MMNIRSVVAIMAITAGCGWCVAEETPVQSRFKTRMEINGDVKPGEPFLVDYIVKFRGEEAPEVFTVTPGALPEGMQFHEEPEILQNVTYTQDYNKVHTKREYVWSYMATVSSTGEYEAPGCTIVYTPTGETMEIVGVKFRAD